MKFVEDAKRSWTWISMQAMALAGALQGAWMYIPEDLKVQVPTNVVHYVTLAILALGIIGRVVKQGTQDAANPPL